MSSEARACVAHWSRQFALWLAGIGGGVMLWSDPAITDWPGWRFFVGWFVLMWTTEMRGYFDGRKGGAK